MNLLYVSYKWGLVPDTNFKTGLKNGVRTVEIGMV